MKIIKINNCGACNYHFISQLSENVTYCQHEDNQYDVSTGGDPIIPEFPNIPEWCCLEDGQNLTPALDILQGYLDNKGYISQSEGLCIENNYSLFDAGGDEIASGENIKELLVNLVKKEEG